jgi:hypothetical protein
LSAIILPWQELAEDTYRSVFTKTKIALDLSGAWLLVAILLAFLGIGVYPILSPEDLGGREVYTAIPFALGLLALICLSIFSTRWTRWVMLNHIPGRGRGLSLGGSELRVGWATIETVILGILPIIGAFWYSGGLIDSGRFELGFGVQGAGVLVGAFLLARSGMAINLAALQVPGSALAFAWRLSAGQTIRLLLLLTITAGPAVLAAWSVEWALDWALAPMPELLGPEIQRALSVGLMTGMGFIGVMLFLGAMGLAARSLILTTGEDPWIVGDEVGSEWDEELEQAASAQEQAYAPEAPTPLSAYGGWSEEEDVPLELDTADLGEELPAQPYESLVPPEPSAWAEPQAQSAPAQRQQPRQNWVSDEKTLGRKIGANKKKQSWTRFLPTLEFDMGTEAWKLAVLGVLLILGYLFLFTDVIEKFFL